MHGGRLPRRQMGEDPLAGGSCPAVLTHQLHPCNLSPVGATDHSTRRVLKNALEADHVNMAVLLRAHGGILGPNAAPDLLGKLDKPDVPAVRDVKWKINRLMRQQVT